MFAEHASSFAINLTLKTEKYGCRWARYPQSQLCKNLNAEAYVKNVESELKEPLNSQKSYFLSQDNGFVFFFTFGKNTYRLCVQPTIDSMLDDVGCYSYLIQDDQLPILADKISCYIDSQEFEPGGIYQFYNRVIGDFSYDTDTNWIPEDDEFVANYHAMDADSRIVLRSIAKILIK